MREREKHVSGDGVSPQRTGVWSAYGLKEKRDLPVNASIELTRAICPLVHKLIQRMRINRKKK